MSESTVACRVPFNFDAFITPREMDKFLERFKPKAKAANKNNGGGGFSFSLLGQNNAKFQGQGQSLGGSKALGKVIEVQLSDPGPLGIRVEKRPNSLGGAIVADVVSGSQGERAGLERGDILCFQGSDGQEEISYDLFLALAKSDQRPLCFEIRRIKTKSAALKGAGAAEDGKHRSAESFTRQQAVIAAAEKREREAKARNKRTKDATSKNLPALLSTEERRQIEEERLARMDSAVENQSEASKEAVEAAKRGEAKTAAQLGYNPYETNRVTAGQARTAAVAASHGTVGQSNTPNGEPAMPPLPEVRPPSDPTVATTASSGTSTTAHVRNTTTQPVAAVGLDFEKAYEAVVTSNRHDDVVGSFAILRKLILNATTKGQDEDEAQASKFRRVRLSNAKIKAAIVDVEGAFDLMVSVGFHLVEEDGESFLVFSKGTNGDSWIGTALSMMEKYEKS